MRGTLISDLFKAVIQKPSKSFFKMVKTISGKRKKQRLIISRSSRGLTAKSQLQKMHFGTFSPCKPFAFKRGSQK